MCIRDRFIATLIFSALFYLNTLAPRYEHKLASIVAVASLLGAHSYYTEYVTFRQSALPMSVMFAMLWIAATQYRQAIFAKDRRTFRLSLALVAGTIAMGANQLALCFAAIAVLYMHLSYTLYDHLPESKSPIVNFKALAQPILVTALAGATLTAVSYTHLDVYKRQLRPCLLQQWRHRLPHLAFIDTVRAIYKSLALPVSLRLSG